MKNNQSFSRNRIKMYFEQEGPARSRIEEELEAEEFFLENPDDEEDEEDEEDDEDEDEDEDGDEQGRY